MASNGGASREVEELRQKIAALQVELKEKEAQADLVYPYSRSYQRTQIVDILGAANGGKALVRSFCFFALRVL
jgi:predicted RNase H-like nuclease (RuvC/YqgF family)